MNYYYISSGGSCFCLTPSYYQDSGLPSKDTAIDDPFVFNAAKVPRKVLYPIFSTLESESYWIQAEESGKLQVKDVCGAATRAVPPLVTLEGDAVAAPQAVTKNG